MYFISLLHAYIKKVEHVLEKETHKIKHLEGSAPKNSLGKSKDKRQRKNETMTSVQAASVANLNQSDELNKVTIGLKFILFDITWFSGNIFVNVLFACISHRKMIQGEKQYRLQWMLMKTHHVQSQSNTPTKTSYHMRKQILPH